MTKIPVFRTVADAYAFAFGNLGVIVGLIWIPMLAYTVIGFIAQLTTIDARIIYETTNNEAVLRPALLWLAAISVVTCLAYAMMIVPVLQQAVGIRKGHAFAHFALGQEEWRTFGGYALLLGGVVLAILAALIAAGIVGMLLGGQAGLATLPTPLAAILDVAALVVFAGIAVTAVRVWLLIPAVTVLEGKADLLHSYRLGKGNTWRLFAIFLLTFIAVQLVESLVLGLVFGWQVAFPELAAAQGRKVNSAVEQFTNVRRMLPVAQALNFLFAPIGVGVYAGAIAAAYRAVGPNAKLPES